MITLDDLGKAIEDEIESYVEGLIPKLEKRLSDTAEDILNYMKRNAPRSGYKNAFADSFVATSQGTGMNTSISIYSEGKGGLTHLLEFGYTHRSGKYVGPRPFMRPAYDMFTPKMLEDIKEIISKGN
ncbi:HK97 gp10 family phage protein [Liberiplasma polymorphum]|uniref:HK97 gp10 family phage protein n=1 Tax=Liberiplasma polymorphum TaxID=3374570 RepID=UPI003771CAD9